jgi:hypothetical protein
MSRCGCEGKLSAISGQRSAKAASGACELGVGGCELGAGVGGQGSGHWAYVGAVRRAWLDEALRDLRYGSTAEATSSKEARGRCI